MIKISLIYASVLLVLLGLAYHISHLWPAAGSWLSIIIICVHILAPLYIIDKKRLIPRDFNLYAYNLESLLDKLISSRRAKICVDYAGLKRELCSSAKYLFAILVPYIICYYFFYWQKAHSSNQEISFVLTFPPLWGFMFLTQIFAVALPEEFFYRGFLQSSLQEKLSPVTSIIITNIFFALGHFVGNIDPARLLTFFPGLVFSWLVYKYKSLVSAVVFHAVFNMVAFVLSLSIALKSSL
jgi:membrane protease YdiL (CAAX protease family)